MSFRELHKERVWLSKERDFRQKEIETWSKRCKELQMLKFGRVIDLDDLEAGSNRDKEDEAEKGVRDQEESHRALAHRLLKESEALQDKLAVVRFLVVYFNYLFIFCFFLNLYY